MFQLTDRVENMVKRLFPEVDRLAVRAILMEQVSETLPLVGNPREIERIQLAVLKVSRGEAGLFLEAAALARQDWRDVLMAAGFGNDVEAHLKWVEEIG